MPEYTASSTLIGELRRMAASDTLDDQTFRRLMLAGMAEVYQQMSEWDKHEHPVIEQRLNSLEKRDWIAGIGAVIGAIIAAVFVPRR